MTIYEARGSNFHAVAALALYLGLFIFWLTQPALAQGQSEWQAEWTKTIEAAEKQGQVNIVGPPGATYRVALVEMFEKKYPKISVEYHAGTGPGMVPKIQRERASGLYNWDLYIGGPPSALAGLKPIGALDPIRPELLLPETFDDAKWYRGFSFGFLDKENKYFYGFGATLSHAAHINWDLVRADELKSFRDLLEPKWAGKIVWEDPRHEGAGVAVALRFKLSYGEDFLKRLLSKQKIAYSMDRRQITEWVIRGSHVIGIGLPREQLVRYWKQGVGKNIGPLNDPEFTDAVTTGAAAVGVFNRRPHPHAARIYLNWLLSKEGQTSWALHTGGRNSLRLDVPVGEPSTAIDPKRKYMQTATEDMNPQRQALMKLAREWIPQ